MEDFKYVINGAIVAAILTVRALPGLFRKCLPNNRRNLRNNRNNRNNRVNNRRTTSGGQQLNRGRFSGMKESLRNIRNRIPFLNSNVSKGTNILNTNPNTFNQIGKGGKSGNFFTNLFKKGNVTTGTGGKPGFKIPKIPGLGFLKGILGKALGPLFFLLDFGGRKGAGQNTLQAGVGAGAAQAGFWGGSAVAAKLLSPLLVTPVPGARILYGVSVFGAGILGAMGLTSVTDKITGANKVGINKGEPKAEVGDKFKKDIASLMDYADYELELTEITNNIIQPIQV